MDTVSVNTCALLPAKEIAYGTTVIEYEKTKMEQLAPFEIIKESCLTYWSDYNGRRNSVVNNLQFKQKTPIPVSVAHKLCFFPTHSPIHMDNCWINYAQISRWAEIPKKRRKGNEQIEITLKNRERITLDISAHTFRTQLDRAFLVLVDSEMTTR